MTEADMQLDQLPPDVASVVRRAHDLTTRMERVKRWGIVYIAIVLTAVAPFVIWSSVTSNSTLDAVRSTQLENITRAKTQTQTLHTSSRTLHLLLDAIRSGAKGQRTALQKVESLIVISQLCSPLVTPANTNYQLIAHCVDSLMKEHSP
jgi:hypothetical protein